MACSKEPKKASSCSPPIAVIGCFVTDDTGNVYALVNRHVTLSLKDSINIVKKDGNIVMSGSLVSTQKSSDENLLLNDIDLIKINDDFKVRCKSVFQTSSREIVSSYPIYEGNVKDVYNTMAHMCFTSEENEKKTNELKGTISQIPQTLVDCYSIENYFIFTSQSDQPCANPGVSGTIIAKDGDHGTIELVGMIAHGDVKLKCTQSLNNETIGIESCSKVDVAAMESPDTCTSNDSICLLLNKGIKFLEKKYNLKLTIYPGEPSDVDTIESGRSYTFTSTRSEVSR